MKKKDCSKMTFKKDLNGALRDGRTGRFTSLIKALKESLGHQVLPVRKQRKYLTRVKVRG